MRSLPGRRREAAAADRPRLPPPERFLIYVYGGRLGLALAAFLAVVWVWTDVPPGQTLGLSATVLVAVFFTAGSYAYTGVAGRAPGETFRYGQSLFDVVFLTAVVLLTGGSASPFLPAYILVICAAAVLLPFRGGILIGVLASLLFFGGVVWNAGAVPDASVYLQVALFASVALITGYLGDRLRQTGTAIGEMETELRLLRLDTDEILAGISTCVLTVDRKGRLVYMNPAAAALLGMDPDGWLDRPVLAELDRSVSGFGALLARSIEAEAPIARSEVRAIDREEVVLGVSTTVLDRGEERGGLTVTAIFQDITAKARLEALRRRTERLEAVAALSASLAHEIKNPLASIRSAAEQLHRGELEAEDERTLERLMLRESDRLTRLLRDFLSFASVKAAGTTPIDVAELARSVVAVAEAHPDANGCPLTVEGPAEGRLVVSGDEDLLHRALFNLVLNAVQWAGADGRVAIRLDRTRTDLIPDVVGRRRVARIRVLDTGPGFPAELVDRVFDPFFTRRAGGTGLGLAMVERAVEAHGGTILVEPADGRGPWGGRVTIHLPEPVAEPAAELIPTPEWSETR